MTLDSALSKAKKERNPRHCKVNDVLLALSKKDAETLRQALDNPLVNSAQIERALRSEGQNISQYPILRHRRRDCPCWDKE